MRKIVAGPCESPRQTLFQRYPQFFDQQGLAVDRAAQALAVLLYQEALNQFLAAMPAEITIWSFRIKLSAVALIGSLGVLRARLGIWQPRVTFEEASRIYEKKSEQYLLFPSDADVRILGAVKGNTRPSAEVARRLALEVYGILWPISRAIFDFTGVYVHPCLDDREEFTLGPPIDLVKGRGLQSLYEIQCMNGPIED